MRQQLLNSLCVNLSQVIQAEESRTAKASAAVKRKSCTAVLAGEMRQKIVDWLEEEGQATAAQVAKKFNLHKTTSHSHLNRLVIEGQAKIVNIKNIRYFIAI